MTFSTDEVLCKARARLKISGKVEIQAVSESEAVSPEFGFMPALTKSNEDASKHEIKYVPDKVDDVDFLHELSHVKLNEIGFKKVELEMEQKALNCKDAQDQEEMKKAIIYVAETYANFLHFKYFREESKSLIMKLDQRFLVVDFIRIIVKKSSSRDITQAVIHRISKKWSGYYDDEAFNWAFEQAFKSKQQRKFYTEIHSILSKLPIIKEVNGQIQNLTQADIRSIKQCVLKLSEKLSAFAK